MRTIVFRRLPIFALFSIWLIGPVGVASAAVDWTGIGPAGGFIPAVAVDPAAPDTLYAGTWKSGIYKSLDGGGHWQPANAGLERVSVYDLEVDPATPSVLYAAVGGEGVYKSSDGGGSWNNVTPAVPSIPNYTALAVDPLTPTTLYAGSSYGAPLVRTTDGGGTWIDITDDPVSGINSLTVDPSDPDTLYAGTLGGVWKSADGGIHWEEKSAGLTNEFVFSVIVSPTRRETLYAGTDGGAFISIDSGDHWDPINNGLSDPAIRVLAIDPVTNNTLYAGTHGGRLFKTLNCGATWSAAESGLDNTPVAGIVLHPAAPATLYAATGAGVYKSADGGGSWDVANAGLSASLIQALAADPSAPATLYAGTYLGGVFKSTDSGANWSATNAGLTGTDVRALAVDPSTPATLYAGTMDGGVFQSADGGETWEEKNTGLAILSVLTLAVDPSGAVYAGTDKDLLHPWSYDSGVYKSADGGDHWTRAIGLYNTGVGSLATDPTAPSTIYAGTTDYGMYKSTDGGANWDGVNTGITGFGFRALVIDPSVPDSLYAGSRTGEIFRSANGGAAWTRLYDGNTDEILALTVNPALPSSVFAGTAGGLIASIDGGATWSAYSPDGSAAVNALAAVGPASAKIYAGTDGSGIYAFIDPPPAPDPFGKILPDDGSYTDMAPVLQWGGSDGILRYDYCVDTVDNSACDTAWISAGSSTGATPDNLTNNRTHYWQVRAVNTGGTTYADGGAWRSFVPRIWRFADVPPAHPFWEYIMAFSDAGITTGCAADPLRFCPDQPVTRAAMAVFLLRVLHGSAYQPPAASHYFADLPVPGKEWQEAWVDEFFREGFTDGCGINPPVFCPETETTRAATAVFILRVKHGLHFSPPPKSHYFADVPVAGKEWMEPWIDQFYREGGTTGCGVNPLIFCPENPVKRQAMAAFIVRAFLLPLP